MDKADEFFSSLKKTHEVLMTIFDDSEELCVDILAYSVETDVNDSIFKFNDADNMLEFCTKIPFKLPGLAIRALRDMPIEDLISTLEAMGNLTNAVNIMADYYKGYLYDKGEEVAELLRLNHPALKDLDLQHNSLDNDEGILIANVIPENHNLTSLSMGYNAFSGECFRLIAKGIARNTSLKYFDIGFLIAEEGLTEESIIAMVKALGRNTSLESCFWVQHTSPTPSRGPTFRTWFHFGTVRRSPKKYGTWKFDVRCTFFETRWSMVDAR